MTTNQKRYAVVMVLCVLLNEVCYKTASYLNWPMWLDMTGTAMAAMVLEPTAGLLVGLVNNFFLSAFDYDAGSLVYYSISAACALIVGLNIKKDGKIQIRRIPLILAAVVAASTLLGGSITIWHGGVPDSAIEQGFYYHLVGRSVPAPMACYLSVAVIKVYDVLASSLLLAGVYLVLPKWLKYGPEKIASASEGQSNKG